MPTIFDRKKVSSYGKTFNFELPVSFLDELKRKSDQFNDSDIIIGRQLYKNCRIINGTYLTLKTFKGTMESDGFISLSDEELNEYLKREERKNKIKNVVNLCNTCKFNGFKLWFL